jgi:hypothetical protein
LSATILLLAVTVLVQAVTGHTVAVQVIVGLALGAALLTFLPRVTDVERFTIRAGQWGTDAGLVEPERLKRAIRRSKDKNGQKQTP